jgi:hypothetical protein
VNAAFLLVTSAWLAGGDTPPPAAKPATPAPIAAPATSTWSGGCGCTTGCEEKPSFFERLKARFAKHKCEECGCGATTTVTSSCGCAPKTECGCGPKFSFGDKLKGLFHKHSEECGCSTCGSPAVVTPAVTSPAPTMDKKLPAGPPEKITAPKAKEVRSTPEMIDITPTASKTTESGANNPFDLDRRYEARVDRAADYSWVTGQLFYVHTDGGLWVLRYAPIWKEESNGGSVVLARDLRMDSYREGDLVTVHGEVLREKASVSLGGPLYRAQSIQLVDRSRQ